MTYADLEKLTAGKETPLSGTNELDENVVIYRGYSEDAQMHYYDVHTYQHNGWTRINVFWEDGTTEELFDS